MKLNDTKELSKQYTILAEKRSKPVSGILKVKFRNSVLVMFLALEAITLSCRDQEFRASTYYLHNTNMSEG